MILRKSVGLVLATGLISLGTVVASAPAGASYPTVSWPAGWANPVESGSQFRLNTTWGALSGGCKNVDKTNDATWYLESGTSAHTGIDMNRADGQDVVAIADGTVVGNGQPWGASNHNVVTVEHTTSTGEKFVAVYAHLYGNDVAPLGPIKKGDKVGRVETAGTGAHLHLGILPGAWSGTIPPGSSASTVDANLHCTFKPMGTVDPLSYLAARVPASAVSGFANHLVQWDGDTATPKTSWYVTPDLERLWVSDATTFNCLQSRGASGPDVLPASILDQLPDQLDRWAPCGDTMGNNRTLRRGMSLKSADGRFTLVLQADGNLVLYGPSGALWSNQQFDTDYAILRSDGNFVTYRSNNTPNWATRTAGKGGNRLVVQSDGNLVLYAPTGAVWASRTSPQKRSVTRADLFSAPVPALCGHPGGKLVNGDLPGIPTELGGVWLGDATYGGHHGTYIAIGDLDGDGVAEGVGIVNCSTGGNGVLSQAFGWRSGPALIGRVPVDLQQFSSPPGNWAAGVSSVAINHRVLTVGGFGYRSANDCHSCPSIKFTLRYRLTSGKFVRA